MEMNKKQMILFSAALICLAALSSVLYVRQRSAGFFPGMKAARYRFLVGQPRVMDNQIPLLEKRTQRNPAPLDLTELSNFYFQQGHQSGDLSWYDKAEDVAKKSLVLLPAPNGAKLTLAKIADARHEFPEAIRLAKEVLREKPTSGANMVLISSNLAMGDLAEAAKYADQAVTALPDLSAYMMRALVMAAQGRDDEAAYDFRHTLVVEDQGGFTDASRMRALWGRFLLHHGDYRNAEALFDESLRIEPGNHLALDQKGEMELQRGNYARAQKYLMDAFTASKQMRYLIFYARAKALSGDLNAAAEVQKMAEKMIRAELGGGRYGHRLDLVTVLLDRGAPQDVAEAVELAQKEITVRHSAEAYALLARSLFQAGRAKEAGEAIQGALRSGVHNPEYYHLASAIETARGNRGRAELYKGLAMQLDPQFAVLPILKGQDAKSPKVAGAGLGAGR